MSVAGRRQGVAGRRRGVAGRCGVRSATAPGARRRRGPQGAGGCGEDSVGRGSGAPYQGKPPQCVPVYPVHFRAAALDEGTVPRGALRRAVGAGQGQVRGVVGVERPVHDVEQPDVTGVGGPGLQPHEPLVVAGGGWRACRSRCGPCARAGPRRRRGAGPEALRRRRACSRWSHGNRVGSSRAAWPLISLLGLHSGGRAGVMPPPPGVPRLSGVSLYLIDRMAMARPSVTSTAKLRERVFTLFPWCVMVTTCRKACSRRRCVACPGSRAGGRRSSRGGLQSAK